MNANSIDVYGQSPIYYAAREGHLDIIKLLIEKGADINMTDKFCESCIFYSAMNGHYEVTEFLIENGANINQEDKKRKTAIHFASKNNHSDIVDLLIKHGAKNDTGSEKDRRPKRKLISTSFENNHNKSFARNSNKLSSNGTNKNEEKRIEEIQKPKKYILVKIEEDGKKIPLTDEEIIQFKEEHPDPYKLLNSEEERKKLIENSNKELLQYDSWERLAKKIINQLCKFKDSDLFLEPVDVEEFRIYDYYDKIKNPMDFGTIKKKLNCGKYTNFAQFDSDINLTFNNCYLYNGRDGEIGKICTNVKNEYQRIFEENGMDKFL